MDIQFLEVAKIAQDFSGFREFISNCGMPDQLQITEPREKVMAQLKPLGIKAKIHICAPGGIKKRWGVDAMGFAVPDEKLDGSWHVAVQSNIRPNDLLTGTLLHELGHYVEQIASGMGYLKGKYAQRGTSFDEACRYLAKGMLIDMTAPVIVMSADELVANLNGAWLSMAIGVDPVHVSATLLKQATEASLVGLSKAIERDAGQIAQVMTQRRFYSEFIESVGWSSEEEMCVVMDAATTRFLKSLRKRKAGTLPQSQIPRMDSPDVGNRIGSVLTVNPAADVFALLYCNPTPVKCPDGNYRMQTESERRETRVTAIIETPGEEDRLVGIHQFVTDHPRLAEKVRKQLVAVGLGL